MKQVDVQIELTEWEHQALCERAEVEGFPSPSDYLHHLLLELVNCGKGDQSVS